MSESSASSASSESSVSRVRRFGPWVLVAALAVAALAVAARPPADDRAGELRVEDRVEAITTDLRCPTCQGLSVADSPSSTARAITEDVRRRIEEGESDDEVKQAYVDRYGEWILLNPRSTGLAAFVWALPGAALVAALGGLAVAFSRWRRQPARRATDEDEALVRRALAAQEPDAGGDVRADQDVDQRADS